MALLYLLTDSLIAFKSALLTCLGIYCITFLKLVYKDARPFWLNDDIDSYNCAFDFAGPAQSLFTIGFFWVYNVIMHCLKYAERKRTGLVIALFSLIVVMGAWVIFAGLYSGTIYIYQNVVGLLYGLIYLVLCLNFDREIHKLCEKTGFIV